MALQDPTAPPASGLLQAALDAAGEALLVTDPQRLDFLVVNEAAQRLFGASEQAIREAGPARLLASEPDALRREYEEVIASGKPRVVVREALLPGQSGRRRRLEFHRQARRVGGRWVVITRVRDTTEVAALRDDHRHGADRLARLIRHVPVSLALLDLDGNVVMANGGPLHDHFGDTGLRTGEPLTACECWRDDAHARHALAAALVEARSGRGARFELRLEGPHGQSAPFDIRLEPLPDARGGPREILFCAVATDTGQAADHSASLFARLFELSNDGIVITDEQARIVAVNHAFTAMTGYTLEEVLGHNPRLLASGQTPAATYQEMWHGLQREGFWRGEVVDRRKDGSTYPKAMTVSAIRDRQGRIVNYVANFSDLSRDREAEARLLYLARHDTLTGLANRSRLAERMEQVLWQATQDGLRFAVVFVDLDQLKDLNDTLGHSAGDTLIQEVARRLAGCVRQEDVVARFGGDEFVLVVGHLPGPGALDEIGKRILRAVQAPLEVGGRVIRPGCSIGIAVFPDDGADRETLLMNADAAMYHAKTSGRNTYQFFNGGLREAAAQRLRLDSELRQALQDGQFVLHYQPKVDLRGVVRGFEALMRWQHPQDGLLAPMRFIPHLEQSGLIREVGAWAVHEACRQVRLWRDQGFEGSVAVNVAERQLRSGDLVDTVRVALGNQGLPASCLEIEITESAALHEPELARQVLTDLRGLGVKVALDDFGTGYSSLAQLRMLPIDCVKLDRSFQPLSAHDANAALCRAAVAMAHALDLQVVAEGVETPLQQAILCDIGVDLMQGFLFGRPAPASAVDLGRKFRPRSRAG